MDDRFATCTGSSSSAKPPVQPLRPRVPDLVEVAVPVAELGGFEALQELVHRPHHVRVRVEGAAREADVRRAVVPEALHQILAAADDADRQAAPERLAVGDHVRADAEVLLRAARREPEAGEDLVEDQRDPPLGADLAQPPQPRRRTPPGRTGRWRALSTSAESLGALAFGCSACSGFTSTQAMSRRVPQHAQRLVAHVPQRVGLARRHRVADARLHVAPPAVVRAAEAHEVRAPRCGSARAAPPA